MVVVPTGERTPLWNVPEGVVVDPRDVMHKDLADFYMQAVVATKLSRCTPFYRLHGFGECKVSNVNVLWVRMFSRFCSCWYVVHRCRRKKCGYCSCSRVRGSLFPVFDSVSSFRKSSQNGVWVKTFARIDPRGRIFCSPTTSSTYRLKSLPCLSSLSMLKIVLEIVYTVTKK